MLPNEINDLRLHMSKPKSVKTKSKQSSKITLNITSPKTTLTKTQKSARITSSFREGPDLLSDGTEDDSETVKVTTKAKKIK